MKKEKKILIMCGGSASGKSTIQRELVKNGYHKIITTTTREIREKDNEKDGVDYHFLGKSEFLKRVENGFFIENEEHGDNLYGTQWSDLEGGDTVPCIIVEPKGAKNLKEILEGRNWKVTVAWIDCPYDVAVERVTNRYEKDEALLEKRMNLMNSVEKDWGSYMNYDIKINGLKPIKSSVKEIKKNQFKKYSMKKNT